ncbi:CBD9-like protein [Acephala macrosclerotiorum]|nr:CBD9-like protein [Acephala macrosclerotiorum]
MHLLVATLALFTAAVCGQKTVTWTEASSGVQYNFTIPEAVAAPFDIYVSIALPVNNAYAAIAFGECMLRSPLLVAWENDTNIVYHPPASYNGTSVTLYKSSSVNAIHWKATFLCAGCAAWEGTSVKAMESAAFGWGVSNHTLANPASANTSIPFHNVGKGHFEMNITSARNIQSEFETLKSRL